jgi:hypothetical protein
VRREQRIEKQSKCSWTSPRPLTVFLTISWYINSGSTTRFLRQQFVVEAYGVRSSSRTINSGVPQGSILSPLLFSLFINDLSATLRDSKFHFYADDLQVYLTGKHGNLAGLANRVNSELAVILEWSRTNGLLLNPRKSQAMLIIARNSPRVLPQIRLGTEPIEWSGSVKDLGIYVDSRLNFSRHVSEVCSKVYATLHRLRLLKYLTPRLIRLKLFKSLILLLWCHFLH